MRDEELDDLIDAGLSAYGEPRAGIEGRVLAAVAADGRKLARRPLWRVWAMGLGAAVCILFAVLVGMRFTKPMDGSKEQATKRTQSPAQPRTTTPTLRSVVPVRMEALRKVRKQRELRVQRLPKQELFPTLRPLSPEMQALAQFGAQAPEKARQGLLQAQAHADVPLNIEPLHIAPLKDANEDGD